MLPQSKTICSIAQTIRSSAGFLPARPSQVGSNGHRYRAWTASSGPCISAKRGRKVSHRDDLHPQKKQLHEGHPSRKRCQINDGWKRNHRRVPRPKTCNQPGNSQYLRRNQRYPLPDCRQSHHRHRSLHTLIISHHSPYLIILVIDAGHLREETRAHAQQAPRNHLFRSLSVQIIHQVALASVPGRHQG